MTWQWAPPASAATPERSLAFRAMGGPGRITFEAGAAPAMQEEAAALALAEVERIELKFSRYRPDSLLSELNASAGSGRRLQLDDETSDLLDFAARVHAASEGRFDITTGVLRRAWNFTRPELPDSQELQRLLAGVGWHKVRWERPWFELPERGLELDLGGICKEYAVDRAAVLLQAAGAGAALVNLAGDLRAAGRRADGRAWKIGIAHPRRPGAVLAEVALAEGALATSGDYERSFQLEGRRYSHLLDARTGWPVEHWQTASVLAPACSAAGVLATVAMLSAERAPALLQAEAVEHLLVDAAGVVQATPAFKLVAPAG